MTLDAFDRAAVSARLLGHWFNFTTGHGLFSADAVDDGTRLLLHHLPETAPLRVLDMGCGYGALGLPVAARFPEADVLLADRDLLAVEYAGRNALAHGLGRVCCQGSLGYRDVVGADFDWVLCNVPARIGAEGVAYLVGEGARRLRPGGELRVVVIRDLVPVVAGLEALRGWRVRRVAEGARHAVFALGPLPSAAADHEALYRRDEVCVAAEGAPLRLERPHDISEDPSHLAEGLPLLLECLPKSPKGSVLCHRGGYGATAVALARRGAAVEAADRDLLALAYTARNARRLGAAVGLRPACWLGDALGEGAPWDLLVAEINTTAGEAVARCELALAPARARQVLWLGLSKWVKGLLKSPGAPAVLATRGAWCVLRQSGATPRKPSS